MEIIRLLNYFYFSLNKNLTLKNFSSTVEGKFVMFQAIENLLENYNEEYIGLALINVHPNILKVLQNIVDHTVLNEACKDPNELEEVIFGSATDEEEKPLLDRKMSAYRRKSSVKSNKSNNRFGNEERKLSVYDLE